MHHFTKSHIASLVAVCSCLCVAVLFGLLAAPGGTAGAAYPLVAQGQPLITDPLHHLSGVVAIPPAQIIAHSKRADSVSGLLSLLTPPIFGPNVDASLNNPSAQNETTISINPE